MTALGLRFFLQLGVLLGILAPEAVALVPKKQLVTWSFVATLAELPPPSHNCDLLTKTTYGYDANGNRLTRKIGPNTDLYSYDFENRLLALAKTTAGGEGNYEYTYDCRTHRVYRAEAPTNGPNVETQIVFSGGTSIQEITLGNTPELAVEYIRGSDYGGGIGGILYTIRDSTPSFTHYNHRGDIVSKTDDNGIITYEAQYEAFGTRLAESGTTEDRQKANTKDEDPTGLLNGGFRYRDLETGTFLTRDPLGFVDGPNMYAYVRQNPWTKFDPEGLSASNLGNNLRKIDELVEEYGGGPPPAGMREAGRKGAWQLASGLSIAVGLTPAGTINEIVDGKDAKGEKLSLTERIFAAVAIIPAGKIAGKTVNAASDVVASAARTGKKSESLTETATVRKLVSESEEVVEIAAKTPLQIAQEGGRHAGILKNFTGKSPAELKKVSLYLKSRSRNTKPK